VIDHITNTVKAENISVLRLQVNKRNKAKDFYEKMGLPFYTNLTSQLAMAM
jgi:hypothetical protein